MVQALQLVVLLPIQDLSFFVAAHSLTLAFQLLVPLIFAALQSSEPPYLLAQVVARQGPVYSLFPYLGLVPYHESLPYPSLFLLGRGQLLAH